ncbi:hypothetical protein ACFE04_000986 [Oxalis oulophora]
MDEQGFKKSDPEQWEFANDDFVRGQPHLMKNIHRRKAVHSHSLQNVQGNAQLTDSERQNYKEDIERLKMDKQLLIIELQKNELERQGLEFQMKHLKEKLQSMEQRQETMAASMARVLQKPGLALNLMPQLESNERKRRLPRISYLNDAASTEDRENIDDNTPFVSTNMEQIDQLESSLTFWENTVQNIGQACIQQNSNMELDETRSCADSPEISSIQLNIDPKPKSPGIDMNSEPVSVSVSVHESVTSNEKAVGPNVTVPTGVNDIFWEQFLTENPGSAEAQEAQSERKEPDEKKNESKPGGDNDRFWWNIKTVNNLAEQMGHLTSAERT